MYAAAFGLHRVGQLQQFGQRLVGTIDLDERGSDGLLWYESFIDQHNIGLGGVDKVRIFRVRQKGQCARATFFYFGKFANGNFLISNDFAVQKVGNLLCCKFHFVSI